MFYDLYVDAKNAQNIIEDILNQLCTLGYRGVALTTEVDDSEFKNEKPKKKTKNDDGDPLPPAIDIQHMKAKFPKLNIYRRINIIVSNPESIRRILQSKNVKQYDILSIQPETQHVLKSLAGTADVDIISFNPESKCSLSWNRKLYNQFVHQNVYFELLYVPAITSQTARRHLISLSHIYHAVGKSKNVIVSSGTYSPNHIRGPYDVMNFNLLFGLSEEQAKKVISKNCEMLLLKAKKQRRRKAIFEVVSVSKNEAEESAQEGKTDVGAAEKLEE